jgi:peroxiredoxin
MTRPLLSVASKKLGFIVVGLALLVITVGLGYHWMLGNSTPDVEFTTIKGDHIRLGDLQGYPVLITFWASDCRPCLEEIPDLVELHRQYSERGFKLISVAMAYDIPSRVVTLAEAQPLPYAVALDPLGSIAAAFKGVNGVPNSFLIAPNGRIALHILGRISIDDLRERIRSMLPETKM